MDREGDAIAEASALFNNVSVLLSNLAIRKGTSHADTVPMHRAALTAITSQLEEHQKAMAGEDEPTGAMKDRLCQLRLERAARCSNLASSIADKSESFALHKEAFEISHAVVQQMVQDTGGVDAIVFAQRKYYFNGVCRCRGQRPAPLNRLGTCSLLTPCVLLPHWQTR